MEKLAIHGGKPVRSHYLPYGRQWIDDEDVKAVTDVLKSDFLTTGPMISAFEKELAAYTGAQYAVTFSNGTAALHAACFAAGIAEGDEVITTSMTFAASANCVLYVGGQPVFADIDPATYNISPGSIEKNITKRTKAIIPVDFTGQPAAYDEITALANKYGLTIIEDAAHALGAKYKGKMVGSLSDMTMFSFHPVKHATTGEGGMITTNHRQYYEKLILFRNHGITRQQEQLTENHGPWYYEMKHLGFNYRMTDIQAALGVSQLKKLPSFIGLRKKYVSMYNKAFEKVESVIIPEQSKGTDSSWHLYVIKLQTDRLRASRREVFEALQKENIGVNVHYIPVHLHPYYKQKGYNKGLCPYAEELYESMITLPLFPAMTESDVKSVIKGVNKVVSYYLR
ncbi:UDP-4-amino-4,6-dideoxy-N-acetyl-beta-L-altrosamine transaminase [Halobacillus sp. A1]|uniref:UDP-4-amino-4, 6-dideoxy-N-acetyl-beta-L-altrosamine transaminase n=1 Tax=Halobacillus sp. A1 TaxID=2880262 RepID=UPI0020A64050|nr:UDP-4-amino-4,6-dideoxy-N-acetyl-beta-L-altrosamine transaminase [Halobacillus sp. A1]MCP3029959.1 UDP-4-amino-4,6-dideoxy-N-acetyl-beta-L-altrosamine transaminase [Halobacillus sp. A1]